MLRIINCNPCFFSFLRILRRKDLAFLFTDFLHSYYQIAYVIYRLHSNIATTENFEICYNLHINKPYVQHAGKVIETGHKFKHVMAITS